jgi:integration host factor subunit beta
MFSGSYWDLPQTIRSPMESEQQSQSILKGDLVARLQQGFPQHLKKDLETVIDVVFDVMTSALKEKRRIEIRGIGSFSLHRQKGREFVNPKTGSLTKCPLNYRIVFKTSKDLKSEG